MSYLPLSSSIPSPLSILPSSPVFLPLPFLPSLPPLNSLPPSLPPQINATINSNNQNVSVQFMPYMELPLNRTACSRKYSDDNCLGSGLSMCLLYSVWRSSSKTSETMTCQLQLAHPIDFVYPSLEILQN